MKKSPTQFAWLAVSVLCTWNVWVRLLPPEAEAPKIFSPPVQIAERAWRLYPDPGCPQRTSDSDLDDVASSFLQSLLDRGVENPPMEVASGIWSVGNLRGLPVVYVPCRGVFQIYPSLWTELKTHGVGAFP